MTEEKQQKFTAKVRRGLVWVHSVAAAELAKKKAEATGVRIEGFTASELADVEVRIDLDLPEQGIAGQPDPALARQSVRAAPDTGRRVQGLRYTNPMARKRA